MSYVITPTGEVREKLEAYRDAWERWATEGGECPDEDTWDATEGTVVVTAAGRREMWDINLFLVGAGTDSVTTVPFGVRAVCYPLLPNGQYDHCAIAYQEDLPLSEAARERWKSLENSDATEKPLETPIEATTAQAVLVCREALALLLSPHPNIPDAAREAVLEALDISDDYAKACVAQVDKAFPHDGSGWQ
jgi:hypothetical protein